jgi:hypothetical protein
MEILLNLSMICCWNLAFNAERSRVIIVVVQVGAVKIYVAAVETLEKNERQDETHSTTKICGKTSLDPQIFRFVKFSFSVTHLMAYYAEIGCSRPLIAWLYR